MKTINYFCTVIALTLSGCVSGSITPDANISTPAVSLTVTTTPVATITLEKPPTIPPVLTETKTPPATLESEQARDAIKTLLQEAVDCQAPCFWGIIPEQTTLNEALNIFTHLGLKPWRITRDNENFYGIIYEFDSGLSVMPTLTVQNDIVQNISIDITPGISLGPREWLAYSPETLINRYGSPSKVNLFLGRGPLTSFTMDMYFDKVNLIVRYSILDLGAKLQICPLNDQFELIQIWMGKNPSISPPDVVPLEIATGMTLAEFSKLMTGDPHKACFNLKADIFP